jgi:hypothetical protein
MLNIKDLQELLHLMFLNGVPFLETNTKGIPK